MSEPTAAFCEGEENCDWSYLGKTYQLAETAAAWHARSTGHLLGLYTNGTAVGIVQHEACC